MTTRGYLLVYREIKEKITSFDDRSIFLEVLTEACWHHRTVMTPHGPMNLQPGEAFISLRRLAEITNFGVKKIRGWISRMTRAGRIVLRYPFGKHAGTIVQFPNWQNYQHAAAPGASKGHTPQGTPKAPREALAYQDLGPKTPPAEAKTGHSPGQTPEGTSTIENAAITVEAVEGEGTPRDAHSKEGNKTMVVGSTKLPAREPEGQPANHFSPGGDFPPTPELAQKAEALAAIIERFPGCLTQGSPERRAALVERLRQTNVGDSKLAAALRWLETAPGSRADALRRGLASFADGVIANGHRDRLSYALRLFAEHNAAATSSTSDADRSARLEAYRRILRTHSDHLVTISEAIGREQLDERWVIQIDALERSGWSDRDVAIALASIASNSQLIDHVKRLGTPCHQDIFRSALGRQATTTTRV